MGFTFRNIRSKDMDLRARLTDWQFVPSISNYKVDIPGKTGVADFGATRKSRQITLHCGISPTANMAALIKKLDALTSWLDPELGLGQLVLDELPERYFTARLDSSIECARLARNSGAFELPFYCPDPYGYALSDENYTIVVVGTRTIKRTKGNTSSFPEYRLMGEVINNSSARWFKITTNGSELKISGRLATNEILVIDTGNMTARVEDTDGVVVKNGLPFLASLNLPELVMGENSIVIEANGATFTSLEIRAKSRWR